MNSNDEELEVVDSNNVWKLFEKTKKRKKISPKNSESSIEVVKKPCIGGFTSNHAVPPSTTPLHRLRRDLLDIDTLMKRIDKNLSILISFIGFQATCMYRNAYIPTKANDLYVQNDFYILKIGE